MASAPVNMTPPPPPTDGDQQAPPATAPTTPAVASPSPAQPSAAFDKEQLFWIDVAKKAMAIKNSKAEAVDDVKKILDGIRGLIPKLMKDSETSEPAAPPNG